MLCQGVAHKYLARATLYLIAHCTGKWLSRRPTFETLTMRNVVGMPPAPQICVSLLSTTTASRLVLHGSLVC
jgi:hypothetical protein